MKKIIAGIIGVVAVMAVTAGAAFAVFTTTATINNVAFTTGTAGLMFAPNNNGGLPPAHGWLSSYTFGPYLAENVFPGYTSGTQYVWLENTSTSDITLAISAHLVSATGSWANLSPVANMSINGVSGPLVNWNNQDIPLGLTIARGQQVFVPVVFSIDSSAGNSISGEWLSTNWVITGTQQ